MIRYVKLIDNRIEFAPKDKGSIINYNLNVDLMLQDGYKLFIEVERPDTIRLYHINYIESANAITETVVYDETQEEAEARIAAEEEAEFNRKFFNTSLGYVSRDVHMKNGTIKDFLTDILPLLKDGLEKGIEIYTYTRELKQSKVPVTQQFISECEQQLIIDFYGEID